MIKKLVLISVCIILSFQFPLEDYIKAPDSSYSYTHVSTIEQFGVKGYVLNFTSVTWNYYGVDLPTWRHWVIIMKPPKISSKTALLFFDEGNRDQSAPTKMPPELLYAALDTETINVIVFSIPVQPLMFSDERKNRTEDPIIAYTWDKCLKNSSDPAVVSLFFS